MSRVLPTSYGQPHLRIVRFQRLLWGPGAADSKAGVISATSYLKGWNDVPLRQLLESALGVPAAVENDVQLGALGEHWRGAARGADDFVFLPIGTGIAAGVFVNGKLIRGAHGTAGEVGYMHVPHASEEAAKLKNREPWRAFLEAMLFSGSGRAHVLTIEAHGTSPRARFRPGN